MLDTDEFQLVNQKFPRIGLQLETVWGTSRGHNYLNNLLFDTRDGAREGFSKDVCMALTKLQLKHRSDFPQFLNDANAVWNIDIYE